MTAEAELEEIKKAVDHYEKANGYAYSGSVYDRTRYALAFAQGRRVMNREPEPYGALSDPRD